jgi:uncharacterized phage infection (PIP) family protein YhgE
LTRQTEDLKEARERLRLENEGLNNVVQRKERLLQEVLERARSAEAESSTLKTQLKQETTSAKKSLREFESQLAEANAISQKSEREYLVLKASLERLTVQFKADIKSLKDEIEKKEEGWRKEKAEVGRKYRTLLEALEGAKGLGQRFREVRDEDLSKQKEVNQLWSDEIQRLRASVEESTREEEESGKIIRYVDITRGFFAQSSFVFRQVAGELARLRRLMQSAGQELPAPS